MVSVERTFVVQRPIQVVVEYLADFTHAQVWDPGTKTCVRHGSGPVEVGSRWHNVSEFRGRETQLEYQLTRWEPDHLVFVGTNKTVTATDDLGFTPLDPGRTQVHYRAHFNFHGVAKLAGPLIKPALEKLAGQTEAQMSRTLDAL